MAHHDTSGLFEDAPVIHSYSRQDAIEDGVLIECPQDLSREAGFVIPIAFTAAAWADAVAWTDGDNHRKGTYQDQDGRLWDVLWMARHAATTASSCDRAAFTVYRVPRAGRALTPRPTQLVAHIGPGDHGEPVLTVMTPGED